MSARRVGVLGGFGPEATVEFMWRLLRATKAEDDQDHIPLVVESNCTIPSRITWLLEGKGEDPEPGLVATAQRLCAAGAEFLVMPCNTTHVFAPQIAAASTVPFLNAVDAAAAAVTKGRAKAVGIIGSPVLQRTKLYEAPLARFGARPVYPADQARLLAGIKEAKSKGPTDFSRAVVGDAAAELAARGADCILVACTEFSLMQDEAARRSDLPVSDAMDVLVAATHDAAMRLPGAAV